MAQLNSLQQQRANSTYLSPPSYSGNLMPTTNPPLPPIPFGAVEQSFGYNNVSSPPEYGGANIDLSPLTFKNVNYDNKSIESTRRVSVPKPVSLQNPVLVQPIAAAPSLKLICCPSCSLSMNTPVTPQKMTYQCPQCTTQFIN